MDAQPKEDQVVSSVSVPHSTVAEKAVPIHRQKFVWMVFLAVIIAIGFTTISLRLYAASPAAKLDLSRPGFEDVRAGLDQTAVQTFDSTGVITEETVKEFQELYVEQYAKTDSNQYESDTLTDGALGMTRSRSN